MIPLKNQLKGLNNMNHFISTFCDLLDLSRWVNPEIHYETITVEEPPRKFLFFKLPPKTKTVMDKSSGMSEQESMMRQVLSDSAHLFTTSDESLPFTSMEVRSYVTFEWMWSFCEFILFAEHTILYPNSSNEKFQVVNVDKDSCAFWIQAPNYYKLKVSLERTPAPLDARGGVLKSIKVDLNQDWSYQTISYLYFDKIAPVENTEFKDQYFSKNISDLIYDTFYNTFKSIINSIIGEYGVKLD